MKKISNRINTIKQLKQVPVTNGVEIDVRDYNSELILSHDPFSNGELLYEFLKNYRHSTLIINSKSEGIEFKILELLTEFGIDDFFFLDCSFAIISKFISSGERRFAARYSEIESLQTVLNLKDKAEWVWVDCFTSSPHDEELFRILKKSDYKICIVSPDLVGRKNEIPEYVDFIKKINIIPDAVCVKLENEAYWNLTTFE